LLNSETVEDLVAVSDTLSYKQVFSAGFYDIGLKRNMDKKIRVCCKESIPSCEILSYEDSYSIVVLFKLHTTNADQEVGKICC